MLTVTSTIRSLNNLEHGSQLRDEYISGQREFSGRDLQALTLTEINLSYARFKGANLRHSDLQESNLKGINLDQANLSHSNLQNADLRGASLKDSMLFMTALSGANLQGADLSGVSLDAAILDRANLQGADLSGAYLCGVDLSEVNLNGAYFNHKTKFDDDFDPLHAGMQTEVSFPIHVLLDHLNSLSRCSERYLGSSLVTKYWERSRPDEAWMTQFQVDRKAQFSHAGALDQPVSILQIKCIQRWINQFIGNCSHIFQELASIADQDGLLVITESLNQYAP